MKKEEDKKDQAKTDAHCSKAGRYDAQEVSQQYRLPKPPWFHLPRPPGANGS